MYHLLSSLNTFVISDDDDNDKENRRGVVATPTCYSTPVTSNIYSSQRGLYTPSATKSVKRSRYKMVTELFELFNETVFDNEVCVVKPPALSIMDSLSIKDTVQKVV